jgi:hypothetical protein
MFKDRRRVSETPMKILLLPLLLAVLTEGVSFPSDFRPRLNDGIVTYVGVDGRQKTLEVGARCADLWVAPDETLIAFIAIVRERTFSRNPRLDYDEDPLIEESNIYIARKSNQFRPVRIHLKPIVIGGRSWSVVRNPTVSPDEKMVYFTVPFTMTTSKLFNVSLLSGGLSTLGDTINYCVIWNGKYSGELLMQQRYLPVSADAGVINQCYLWRHSGLVEKVLDDCEDFGEFANKWSQEHGGTCTGPIGQQK